VYSELHDFESMHAMLFRNNFMFFMCVQCGNKYCDLPVECKVCGELGNFYLNIYNSGLNELKSH